MRNKKVFLTELSLELHYSFSAKCDWFYREMAAGRRDLLQWSQRSWISLFVKLLHLVDLEEEL